MNSSINRRDFLHIVGCTALSAAIPQAIFAARKKTEARPNILFCLADDQSWPHASAYGDKVIKTPNFDRIAKEGVLFNHAYCAAPSCTPSRSGILTGQHIWRLEQGGQLFGTLPQKYPVYTNVLSQSGYHVGFMRKGWAPGNVKAGGRSTNPAGDKSYKNFQQFFDACCPHRETMVLLVWQHGPASRLQTRQWCCFWYGFGKGGSAFYLSGYS